MKNSINLHELLRRKLIMVGGKGGVGKSTVAATLATLAAERGLRTLVVSTDPAHNLCDLFDCEIGSEKCEIPWSGGKLAALEIDPVVALDTYLETVRRQMLPHVAVSLRGQLEKQLHLTRHSPGAEEAALLDEITRLIQNREDYDLLIFDTAPTGHTLRLLSLPSVMSAWTEGLVAQKERAGRFRDVLGSLAKPGDHLNATANPQLAPLIERKERFRDAAKVLRDPEVSAFLFVMTAEMLPLNETLRAVASLRRSRVPVAGLLLNRLLPEEAAEIAFLRGTWECQRQVLERMAEQLGDLPNLQLPMTGQRLQGRGGLQWLAAQLLDTAECVTRKQKQPGSVAAGLS